MENLSIVIPVYNEEKAISDTVALFRDMLNKYPGIEVIFVDDGSTDRTRQILKDGLDARMKLVVNDKNKGYGAAIKKGVQLASHDHIAITDADGSYPNERIIEFFQKLVAERAAMVVGARTGKMVKIGILRKLPKLILTKLAEYLSESEIPDLNSGLRVISKELIQKSSKYLPQGFSFTTTITLFLLSNNHKILYIPIDYYKRVGKSKIKPLRDTMNFIQLIIRTVMFFNPLKVFLPLSLFFVLMALAVLIVSYLMGRVMDVTTILLFVTGLQLLALGLLADLIDKRLSK
ncbi:MAG TPA: glycosyltransferase family 2 protein [Candidatus Desulfaltia sp.]|nr:glycosyltransferase family 2 protein [Candidatus Desulfaltia sp.]